MDRNALRRVRRTQVYCHFGHGKPKSKGVIIARNKNPIATTLRSEKDYRISYYCRGKRVDTFGVTEEEVSTSAEEDNTGNNYLITIGNVGDRTKIELQGNDRGRGLLSDVSFAIASLELDIIEGTIKTSLTNSMNNTFLVQRNGAEIAEEEFKTIERTLLAACMKSATLSSTKSLRSSSINSAAIFNSFADDDFALQTTTSQEASIDNVATAEPVTEAPKWTAQTIGAILLVNVAAMLFGSNQVLIKVAETEVSPSTINLIRFLIAGAAFLPFGISAKVWKKPKLLLSSLELGTYLFIGYTSQVLGLGLTTASRGAVMSEFSVLIVPFLAMLTGKKIPGIVWFAATMAFVGVGMVTNSGDGGPLNYGDALCILSASCFGIHVFRSEQKTAVLDSKKDITGLISAQLVFLALTSGIYEVTDLVMHSDQNLWTFAELAKQMQGLPWPNLLFMGLGTTAFTLWIEISALQYITSTMAALIYTTEPLWGAAFAAYFLHENFGVLGYIGSALIVGSTMLATTRGGITKEVHNQKTD